MLELLDTGAHVVAMDDLYGGSYRLFERVRKRSAGLAVHLRRSDAIPARSRRRSSRETRMIWVETPTNPLLKLVDLGGGRRRSRGDAACSRVADNTFASPWICSGRSSFGFDIVMHSATKYLNGHSDMVGGVRGGRRRSGTSPSGWRSCRTRSARIAGPFDCFLALRGLKTLALRMERHCENALRAGARGWSSIRRSSGCIYPGLAAIRSTSWRSARCSGFGGMVSIVLKGGLDGPRRFLERCELFALAESLGGVESLIEHPAIMTHASIPEPQRAALGIGDGLVRLSVGVEDVDDLRAELSTALDVIELRTNVASLPVIRPN